MLAGRDTCQDGSLDITHCPIKLLSNQQRIRCTHNTLSQHGMAEDGLHVLLQEVVLHVD